MAKQPRKRPSRPKMLMPDEEALLYDQQLQPPVLYPPVVLPAEPIQSTRIDALGLAPIAADPASATPATAGIRRKTTTARVQVGLDFGTSTTKVMYRQLGVAEERTRIVHFDHGLSGFPSYCLPSLAAFDTKGNLLLGAQASSAVSSLGWGAGLSRLKMLIAGRVDDRYLDHKWKARYDEHVMKALGDERLCTPEALATVFLAYVFRRVRQHIEGELGSEVDLIINTCVPVDQRERTPVVHSFEKVLAAAWELEQSNAVDQNARGLLDKATRFLETVRYDLKSDDTRVFLMPEAIASAAGYLTSQQRQSGLHAIVDLGAGTTDVSICHLVLRKAAGAHTDWYAARSIPMGAARLEGMVASTLGNALNRTATQDEVYKALRGEDANRDCERLINEELTRIWNGTTKAWAEAFGHYSGESAWRGKAVTVFLTGGGSMISAARGVFSRSWMPRWGPYPCNLIPTPDDYDSGSTKAPFFRLSVAFGLATPLPALGEHTLPSGAPDDTPPKPPVRDWRQDGDQLLPRWGWI